MGLLIKALFDKDPSNLNDTIRLKRRMILPLDCGNVFVWVVDSFRVPSERRRALRPLSFQSCLPHASLAMLNTARQ